ncbi:MAG: sterol desaturase family protein [Candidatus Pacebacteria bacterium]|nr:sterol desaturase family protein [Candidatus Paceibacterota bacterium]
MLLDLIFYLVHRMHHSTSLFWVIHSTHHSDNYLNTSTFLRSSWFQKMYQWLFLTIPLFFGFTQSTILFCLVFIYSYQLIVHSQYVIFPKWIDKFFVTSRSHSLHHDEAIKSQSCNFGEVLNIWDVLFGTYKYRSEEMKVSFGILEKYENTLWSIQMYGLNKYIREKIKVFKR